VRSRSPARAYASSSTARGREALEATAREIRSACGVEVVAVVGDITTEEGYAAPDRILWGTDWPHPNVGKHMPNDGDLVDLFARMAPEPLLQRRILVENPARLYGF
jgi:predicted TIM-barrel fold metal-dependent hydrolase